jgi:proteasome accessory factor A
MEADELQDAPRLAQPVEDMWATCEARNPEKWEVHLEGGKVVSPIDIQRYYLAKAEPLVETERERFAFKAWEQVLDGLEKKRSKDLARRVEWLDRYYAIQEAKEEKGGADVEMMACKQYSEIGVERSLFYRRQRAGLLDRVVTDDEIMHAIREPPQDTRAAVRRRICDMYNIEKIDWSLVVVNDDGARKRIELPDPLDTSWEAS